MEAIPTRANKIESNPITNKSFFEENPLNENHQILSTATKQDEMILLLKILLDLGYFQDRFQ